MIESAVDRASKQLSLIQRRSNLSSVWLLKSILIKYVGKARISNIIAITCRSEQQTIFGAPAYSLIYSGTQINYEMQKHNNNFCRVPQKKSD
jgi:hypothetical protein